MWATSGHMTTRTSGATASTCRAVVTTSVKSRLPATSRTGQRSSARRSRAGGSSGIGLPATCPDSLSGRFISSTRSRIGAATRPAGWSGPSTQIRVSNAVRAAASPAAVDPLVLGLDRGLGRGRSGVEAGQAGRHTRRPRRPARAFRSPYRWRASRRASCRRGPPARSRAHPSRPAGRRVARTRRRRWSTPRTPARQSG